MSSLDLLNSKSTYVNLPTQLYKQQSPTPVDDPTLITFNQNLNKRLKLPFDKLSDNEKAQFFSGNKLPPNLEPLTMAYAGHQFGNFTILGDGRAHLLGEWLIPSNQQAHSNQRVDIQLKGSGRTHYSRNGDGRAGLGPMLREYLISEAMHALMIPTTRSLAVVSSGEMIYRECPLHGAILTRVAASHLRIGTFEYAAHKKSPTLVTSLADYTIQRHFPQLIDSEQPYLSLLKSVVTQQMQLVIEWLRVGFIHGVMNTDNITLSGETIDYGPCAFMDHYNPNQVFSSIDYHGRYAFNNQAPIMLWNLCRFAETLIPLLHKSPQTAIELAAEVIVTAQENFDALRHSMMKRKLGITGEEPKDASIIETLLNLMHSHKLDYTNTFMQLTYNEKLPKSVPGFQQWHEQWQNRIKSHHPSTAQTMMKSSNPVIIPRNHLVEQALTAAETQLDFSLFNKLLDATSNPYQQQGKIQYQSPPTPEEQIHHTFCGT